MFLMNPTSAFGATICFSLHILYGYRPIFCQMSFQQVPASGMCAVGTCRLCFLRFSWTKKA